MNMSENHTSNDTNLVSESVKEIFQKCLEEKGLIVDKIDIEAGSIKGDNYLGIIAKAEVTCTDKNGETVHSSYIIKSAPKSEGMRESLPIHNIYNREIYMYGVVHPKMKQFQLAKGVKKTFCSVAQCLTTTHNLKDEALILQDMKAIGYKMKNRKVGLDYNHVKLVLTELAHYHSISFAIKDQEPELFEEFMSVAGTNAFAEMSTEDFQIQTDTQMNKAHKFLDPEKEKDIFDRFLKYGKTASQDIMDMMEDNKHPYCVLRHGDCWTNNFLFAYKDIVNPYVPTNVCLLDWQISHVASPVLDLMNFIFASTDRDLKEKHYDELLKIYHNKLVEFGAEMGSDIHKLYPYDIFMEHLVKYGRYGVALALMMMPLLTSDSDEIPDVNTVHDKKDKKSALDWMEFESKHSLVCNQKIRDAILFAAEKKYI